MNKLRKTLLLSVLAGAVIGVQAARLEAVEEPTTPTSQTQPAMQPAIEETTADAAKDDFKSGLSNIGGGFKKGAKVTGGAFKKAGKTMGGAFKKAGSAIKNYFTGKKSAPVEERDLSGGAAAPQEPGEVHHNTDLDSVGDEAARAPRDEGTARKNKVLAQN